MLAITTQKIFIASQPIDFRMSIDGLSSYIHSSKKTFIHDGSIYVFYNKNRDKVKCLFWDKNGFVLYYKRLDQCKFKIGLMKGNLQTISPEELQALLSGLEPIKDTKKPLTLEHQS